MRSTLKVPKCVLATIYSNSFSHCKGDQKKTVAISQMFNHVHLLVLWIYLLNTYITPTVQILHYCDQDRRVNEVVQP